MMWSTFGDVNGDGLQDLIFTEYPSLIWKVRLNKGGVFGAPLSTGLNTGIRARTARTTYDPRYDYMYINHSGAIRAADTDGDGIDELFVPTSLISKSRNTHWEVIADGFQEPVFICSEVRTGDSSCEHDYFSYKSLGEYINEDRGVYRWAKIKFGLASESVISAKVSDETLQGVVNSTSFDDLNGDGITDITTLLSRSGPVASSMSASPSWRINGVKAYVSIQGAKKGDVLAKVTDGAGISSTWQYAPLTALDSIKTFGGLPLYSVPSMAERYAKTGNDYFYLSSPLSVVSRFTTSVGSTEKLESTYAYSEGIYHKKGRGFQGFRSITEENNKGLSNTVVYSQKFPLSGVVEKEVIKVTPAASTPNAPTAILKDVSNTVSVVSPFGDNKTFCPHISSSRTVNRDLGNKDIGTTTRSTTMDGYCNADLIRTTVSDGLLTHTTEIDPVFTPQTTPWWPSKSIERTERRCLDKPVCSDSDVSVESKQRVVISRWFDELRRLPATTISGHPTDATLQVQTAFDSYDAFGNNTKKTVKNADGVSSTANAFIGSRSTETTFTSDGYFVQSTKDPSGAVSSFVFSQINGEATQVTDPEGRVTDIDYDAWDRVISKQNRLKNVTRALAPETYEYRFCSAQAPAFDANLMTDCSILGASAAEKAWLVVTANQLDASSNANIKAPVVTYLDRNGRVLRTSTIMQGGTPSIVDNEYDAWGRVIKQGVPWNGVGTQYFTRFTEYDLLDRPKLKIVPNGEHQFGLPIEYLYDGLTTHVTVAKGSSRQFTLSRIKNPLGQWSQTVDQGDDNVSNKVTTKFRYDAMGNPIEIIKSVKSGAVIKNTASYNVLGHKVSMTDPDRGSWQFEYSVLGELKKQTDAKGQVTEYSYDALSRPLTRKEAGAVVADWAYGANSLNGLTRGADCLASAYQISMSRSINATDKIFCYDSAARLTETRYTLKALGEPNKSYSLKQTYDDNARLASQSYPGNQLIARYTYDVSTGKLAKITDQSGTHLESNLVEDVFGNLEQQKVGSSELRRHWYDASDARLTGICTTGNNSLCSSIYAANALQALDYGVGVADAYDEFGSLIRQRNHIQDVTETFSYDLRFRLTQSTRVSGLGNTLPSVTTTINYEFNAFGNMVKKDDVADLLIYGNGKPHQVSQTKNEKGIELSSYQYDANGNQTISTGARARTIDYNVNNQPIYIEAQGNAVTIRHDDAFERYFEKHSIGTKTIKYWKLGKQFEVKEVWENGNKTEELHNHYVGSRTLFQYYPMSNIKRWRYLHTDRLGSVETISDGNGNWLERNSYDPFGKVRQPNAMQDRNCVGGWNCLNSQISQRGFTGTHEHLDAVSVINMGGRIYDQELGRFLSVDPFMTSPLNAQSLNPYSYVGNSPLMGTDPTGYICALNARQYAGSVCLGDKPEQQGAKSTPMTGSRIRGVDTGAKCSGSCSVRSTNGKQNSQSTGDRNKPSHAIQLSGNPTASKTDEVGGRNWDEWFEQQLNSMFDNFTPSGSAGVHGGFDYVPRDEWASFAPDESNMLPNVTPYFEATFHHSGNKITPQQVEALHRWRIPTAEKIARQLFADPYDNGDVGYHFLISPTGTVYEGRSLFWEGAHVSGSNSGNIGIAFLGDFSNRPISVEAYRAAGALLHYLNDVYGRANGGPLLVRSHGEFNLESKGGELAGARSQIDRLKVESLRNWHN